ncbi:MULTISPECIES: Fmu (Sun) domain-containing protein [unclassified Paraflavitalea]|uniref:Fmu (Sun) domain-containing protein n=1 Tax=unclassified Paraflavitalea TaxID=2798305 RepID=UPI003D3290CA
MSRYYSYINTAASILHHYQGAEPLAAHLKKIFAQNKKMGSKDRKWVTSLCYDYCRVKPHLTTNDLPTAVLQAHFLLTQQSTALLEVAAPEWNLLASESFQEKIERIGASLTANIAWVNELSLEINKDAYFTGILHQPPFYLRLRPSYEKIVVDKLKKAELAFESMSPTCIALQAGLNIENIIQLNREAVVQDLSSQRVQEFYQLISWVGKPERKTPTVWDCCAASGGKSILLFDTLSTIELSVSDIRDSILHNLSNRFKEAGIKNYHRFVFDAGRGSKHDRKFDLVIADVPCTGSGTWSRTPEQYLFFDQQKIETYAAVQSKIVSNVLANVKPGGYFLYCTCSVFTKENEERVQEILSNKKMRLVYSGYLDGTSRKADTLFAALFISE